MRYWYQIMIPRKTFMPTLLGKRRAVAAPPNLAAALFQRERSRVRVRLRLLLHQCLWQVRSPGEIQGLYMIYPTLIDCLSRFPALYRKRRIRTARVSSCENSGVSSANDTPTCEPPDEGLSAINPNEDWWDSSEVEQHKECEETSREIQENSLPSLRPAKRRYRPSAHNKPFRRRGTKRHRFSSPFSSDLEIDTGEESDHSTYTSSKAHDSSKSRPRPSYPISLNGDASEGGKMEIANERSGMAVIYEQQSWEGEIIDERDTKQGRGRPRKQYLVQWKPSWVDGGRLTASGSVQIWREKKASRDWC